MTTCPDCGGHLRRIVTYSYDDHVLRLYVCSRCGQRVKTIEQVAGIVEYTCFAPPADDRIPLVIARTDNYCRGVQDLDRRSLADLAADIFCGRRRLIVLPSEA